MNRGGKQRRWGRDRIFSRTVAVKLCVRAWYYHKVSLRGHRVSMGGSRTIFNYNSRYGVHCNVGGMAHGSTWTACQEPSKHDQMSS